MSKIIVYDFDETLTVHDCFLPYILFANKNNRFVKLIKVLIYNFIRITYRLNIISNFTLKKIAILLFIKGYDKLYLEDKGYAFLYRVKFKDNIVSQLINNLKSNDIVYVTSASLSEYTNALNKKYKSIIVLSSELLYENNKVVGFKFNNYSKNKVNHFNDIEIDCFYTDSISDFPLAQRSKKIIHVNKMGEMTICNNIKEFISLFNKKSN